jgi:hypothetical protein
MRSSKSRSRSKANRPRTLGNIINRVFDSSGPEGKVRGTPQQIIEKYLILARDAQLSNDRVAAENFQQHAEHYTRMLGEAMREMAAEQEARQGQPGQGQGGQGQGGQRRDDRDWQQNGNGNGNGTYGGGSNERRDARPDYRNEGRGDYRPDPRTETRGEQRPDGSRGSDVIDLSAESDGHLVETPEARAARREAEPQPRRDRRDERRDRAPRPERDAPEPHVELPAAVEPVLPAAEAAPAPSQAEEKPRAPRRPRGPRKPREDGAAPESGPDTGPREAAE